MKLSEVVLSAMILASGTSFGQAKIHYSEVDTCKKETKINVCRGVNPKPRIKPRNNCQSHKPIKIVTSDNCLTCGKG